MVLSHDCVMKKLEIGITGATGFIGKALVKRLISKKYPVSAFVLKKKHSLPRKVKVFRGNLLDIKSVEKFVKKNKILIHLAARVLPPEEKMFDDNVLGTYNLIKKAEQFEIKQIIYVSTAAVYGGGGNKTYKETDFCNPNTEYSVTKYLAEKLVQYWAEKTGGVGTILRPFNAYGPNNKKGVVYELYKSMKNEGKVVISGSGKQKRDFLYVDDLVAGIERSLKLQKNGVFNMTSGENYTIIDLVALLEEIQGKKFLIKHTRSDSNKPSSINLNGEKIMKELGWEAKIKLREGLKKTISWYEQKDI